MFDNLRKSLIVKQELGVPATFPTGLAAVINGMEVIEFLYLQEKQDYKDSQYFRLRLPTAVKDVEAFQSLKTRFMSRITSYIVTVCTIDGILRRSYVHFIKCLNEIGYSTIIPDDNGESLLHQRKEEIKDYSFYRNKVFAHTAFADPVTADSYSLQYSSLYYFSGNLIYMKDDCLALGGGCVIIDEEERPPQLSIVYGYPHLCHHYLLWEHMFTDILKCIPRKELERKIDRISIIRRKGSDEPFSLEKC